MLEKKYQIFISSTYTDLKKARTKIIKTVLELYHIPIGMEMFSAEDEEQWNIITRTILQSDYYVLVLGLRYGSIDNNGVSFTEKEYDFALKNNIPILAFILDENVPMKKRDRDDDLTKILEFKRKVLSNTKMADFWSNVDELSQKVSVSLIKQMRYKPAMGWVRGDNLKNVEENSETVKISKQFSIEEKQQNITEMLNVPLLSLHVGCDIFKNINSLKENLRKGNIKIALDTGVILPEIEIIESNSLKKNEYEIFLKGVPIDSNRIYINKYLLFESKKTSTKLEGVNYTEPAFGLDAIWIKKEEKEDAVQKEYVVVSWDIVISTHLFEVVKKNLTKFVTRQVVNDLLSNLKKENKILIEDVLKITNVSTIQRIFKNLIEDDISIRDLVTILEIMIQVREQTDDYDTIYEQIRRALSHYITKKYTDENRVLKLVTLDHNTEKLLLSLFKDNQFIITVGTINSLIQATTKISTSLKDKVKLIIVVDPIIRKKIDEIYSRFSMEAVVLSYAEIEPSVVFEVVGSIKIEE